MPLSLANVGEDNIIKKIGGKPEVKKHLENLGFVVGGTVKVISAFGGNVIVAVKEVRVAISEEMARKIMILQSNYVKEVAKDEDIETGKNRRSGQGCQASR